MSHVTKNVFLNAQLCPTLGWYVRNQPLNEVPSEGDLFRMAQGVDIGERARILFPDGVHVAPGEPDAASAITLDMLGRGATTTVFEGTFAVDAYVAKPDILRRTEAGWNVFEVKSSLEDTDQLDDLIDDLAYTVMVIKKCGVTVASASLILISRAYRRGMGPDKLLVTLDQTAAVDQRLRVFEPLWAQVRDGTGQDHAPPPTFVAHCKQCGYFADHCLGLGIADPIIQLPNLHKNKAAKLWGDGIKGIAEVPDDYQLTDNQKRVAACVKGKCHFASPDLGDELCGMTWPAYYLDFESVMTCLPLYAGVAPYEQIVTQYSIHRCSAPGQVIGHMEYLAPEDVESQRELAERLLHDLGEEGTIVVYSSFEATRIEALARRYEDLADRLRTVKARLFDLLQPLRRNYYHPDFKGSYSIKRALPVLVPEMSYEGLGIGDGDTAIARFAKLALAKYSAEEAATVRSELLEYCEQDTLAMVKLHESLLTFC